MPRYDYRCKKCGHDFEVSHGINDTVKTCEKCGGDVRRVFHPVGIVFKGSGFYATDSKKPDNKPSKPYSEAEQEIEKATSGSNGNGDKDKDKSAKDDKKPAGPAKTEKAKS